MIANELFDKTYKKGIPLYTLFELTYRCNLRCRHCYIPEVDRKTAELETSRVKMVIKDISLLGGLYMVFTGGEVFLRGDIFELCKFAKGLGFFVIVFTNGTLLDAKKISGLKDVGVDKVEISLYGDKVAHDYITRKKNSYERTVRAVKEMKKLGIDVCIKSPLMSINLKDRRFLENFAKLLGINCKFDAVVTPKNDGDDSPVRYNLSRKELKKIFAESKTKYRSYAGEKFDIQNSLSCSAGRNIVGITPSGKVFPCIQLPYFLGDLNKSGFADIWRKRKLDFSQKRNLKKYTLCLECGYLNDCNRCPGLALLESDDIYGCSKTAKFLAKIGKRLEVRGERSEVRS